MTVSADMRRLLTQIAHALQPDGLTEPLRAGGESLLLDGLALSLARDYAGPELLCHTNETAALLDDVQYTQGQGPSSDAARTLAPVLAPDLADVPLQRWPGLYEALHDLGVRAVFAFPLTVGVIHVGILTGHRTRPGSLTSQQTTDAVALTEALTELLTAPGAPARLTGGPHLHRAEVHQATGMTAVQLNISAADALVRIRAHSYRHNQPLLSTARAILDGHLRLGENSRPPRAQTEDDQTW